MAAMVEIEGHMCNMLVGCQQPDSAVSRREGHHYAAGKKYGVEPSFKPGMNEQITIM